MFIINLDLFPYIVLVVCGVGLFLYGITLVSKVLKRMASKKLESAITKCSKNRFLGLLTGAGFTAIIQSSSGTSALTIGLVRAGIMTLVQASAILIGANIGTTITAFIVSIPLMDYLPLLLFIGSLILMLATRKKWQNFGELFFSFGAIFFGLFLMDNSLTVLASGDPFKELLTFLSSQPWLGLLIGAALTALLQSSSAVVGVLQGIYAVSGGVMSLFGVLPIVFGSNIGTTSTALISSIGGSKESKRVALFHVFFNVSGALLFMGLAFIFKDLLETPLGYANAAGEWVWYLEPKIQIALCHLIFNSTTAIIFFPLLPVVCKLLNKIIKDDPNSRTSSLKLKDLDKKFIRTFPTQGILLAKEQVSLALEYSKQMFETINLYLDNFKDDDASFVHEIESAIDRIDRQLNEYLLSVEKGELTESDFLLLTQTLKGCKDIERIGDYAENLIAFYENCVERKVKLEGSYMEFFKYCNDKAIEIITKTITVFTNGDLDMAINVIQDRRIINSYLDDKISEHFDDVSTVKNKSPSYLDLVYVDIVNCYERVYSHCSNIAKLFKTDKKYVYSVEEQIHFDNMKNRY